MTYNGAVTLTVVADRDHLLPNADHFMALFNSEFEILKKAVLKGSIQDNVIEPVESLDTKRSPDSGFTSESEDCKKD